MRDFSSPPPQPAVAAEPKQLNLVNLMGNEVGAVLLLQGTIAPGTAGSRVTDGRHRDATT